MLKRLIAMLALLVMLAPAVPAHATVATETAAARVTCRIPTRHKVVCYNYTPYAVRVKLNLYTTAGLRVKYFTMRYTRYTVYSAATINRITWRWWWA
jgi:hypothetical protein